MSFQLLVKLIILIKENFSKVTLILLGHKEKGYDLEVTLLTAQPEMDCVVLPPFNINRMMDQNNHNEIKTT